MGKTYRRRNERDDQELFLKSKRRAEPDLRKLARALLAIAQQEVSAEAAHQSGETSVPRARKSAGCAPDDLDDVRRDLDHDLTSQVGSP